VWSNSKRGPHRPYRDRIIKQLQVMRSSTNLYTLTTTRPLAEAQLGHISFLRPEVPVNRDDILLGFCICLAHFMAGRSSCLRKAGSMRESHSSPILGCTIPLSDLSSVVSLSIWRLPWRILYIRFQVSDNLISARARSEYARPPILTS
jgi:hypothetical protein